MIGTAMAAIVATRRRDFSEQEWELEDLIRTMRPETKIVTFTGASGSGKSSSMSILQKIEPRFSWMQSVTTREMRESDHLGEYKYVSDDQFEITRAANLFLWDTKAHGNKYGTTKQSIETALTAEYPTLMHLVPRCVPILQTSVGKRVLSFFVHVENKNELRHRIKHRDRHASNAVINERITSCARWTQEARDSGIPYRFIDNSGTPEETMAQVLEGLRQSPC